MPGETMAEAHKRDYERKGRIDAAARALDELQADDLWPRDREKVAEVRERLQARSDGIVRAWD